MGTKQAHPLWGIGIAKFSQSFVMFSIDLLGFGAEPRRLPTRAQRVRLKGLGPMVYGLVALGLQVTVGFKRVQHGGLRRVPGRVPPICNLKTNEPG